MAKIRPICGQLFKRGLGRNFAPKLLWLLLFFTYVRRREEPVKKTRHPVDGTLYETRQHVPS
jgi:hypothetical protein